MDGPLRGRRLRLSGARGSGARLLPLAPPLVFLAVFFALPLAETLRAGLQDAAAWTWLRSDYVRGRVAVALLQALLSVLLTVGLAWPLAWLHHRYAIPWSRGHLALHAAAFVLPVFVVVYGVQLALGERGLGVLDGFGPLGAVVIAHAYYNYGFAARIFHGVLDRRPARLEEAARVLGASPSRAFLRVSLPLLLPAMAAVALLVFLFSFASFGVVLFLGGGEVSTLETMLYQNLGGAFPRHDRAAVLGLVQLALNLALFAGYLALRRRQAGLAREPPRDRAPAPRWAKGLAWALLGIGVLPALLVLVNGFRVAGAWSLEPWRALLDRDHPAHLAGFALERAVGLSLFYAACTILVALGLTLLLAYGVRRLPRRARAAAEVASALPLGTSSLLIGFGFLLAFGVGSWLDLRGSLLGVVVVHALVAFPFAARVVIPALDLHDPRLDEAAALLGAPPRDVVRRIHLPLLRGPLVVAAGLAAAMSLGDFGASLLLMRPDNMALSVWIGRHDFAFDPLRKSMAIALAGLLMLMAAAAYVVVERLRPMGSVDA